MLLAIDTSGPDCAAALYDCESDRLVSEVSETLGRGHAERLMPMLEEMLARANLGWTDITRLGVVTGPGSFTGLRVGLATARGLSLALDVPCNGVTVFEAFSEAYGMGESLGVVIDARRDQIWMQCFENGVAFTDPLAVANDAVARDFPENVSLLAGSAAPFLTDNVGIAATVVSEASSPPIAAVARYLARQDPALQKPKPLYLRAPDAKPQIQQSGKG